MPFRIPKMSNKFKVSFWVDLNTPFKHSIEIATQLISVSDFPVYIGPHLYDVEGQVDFLFEDDSQNVTTKAVLNLAECPNFIVKIAIDNLSDSTVELIQLEDCVIDAVQLNGLTYQKADAICGIAQITYKKVSRKFYP